MNLLRQGVHHKVYLHKDIQEMAHLFRGAIVAYDEGLLSYDKALTNSICRRIFDCKSHDFVKIELLIIYIRKNLANLDNIGRDEFLYRPYVKWIPLKDIEKEL